MYHMTGGLRAPPPRACFRRDVANTRGLCSNARLDELGERVDIALLRRVLRHRAVLADDVDRREALDAKLARDEFALLIATVLCDGDGVAHLVGELLVLLLHTLAELAPRRVDHLHRRLVRARLERERAVLRQLNHLGFARLPQIAVERLLRARDVDAALGLGRAVLVDKADEATLALVAVPC